MYHWFETWTCVAVLVVGLAGIASGNTAGGASVGPAVTAAERNGQYTLANGIVTILIDSKSAAILSMRYKGHELVSTSGHRTIYFSRDGGTDYENLPHCVATIAQRSEEMVDLSCKHLYLPGTDKHAWDVDVHFVLRRGLPGLYLYADVSHPANYPAMDVGEWRMVWSTPPNAADWLSKLYVDDLRHWEAPTPADMAKAVAVTNGPKEVTRLTSGTWQGRYDCKYMYSGDYWDLGCWGIADDQKQMGAWVVFGSHEFFSDGPNKQDLDVAVGTTLVHLNMNHYGGSGIHVSAGQAWEKFYGPWLLYLNSKPSGDACWHDAQEQARAETSAWPYAWVKAANYPLADGRGTVSGTLRLSDAIKPGLSAGNAWVGLAAPQTGPNTDFEFQAAGYQFWVHAKPDGSFVIPSVRPGEYELYAYTTGVVGEFTHQKVAVVAGKQTALGDLKWSAPHKGTQLAWEIGVPDRSAAEFAHGSDYYLPLMYHTLQKEVPALLEYTVGKSDWHRDWYYAQSRSGTDDKPVAQRWRVHFNLASAPVGVATLTLAFAGADRASVNVYVNNEQRPMAKVSPSVQGGNGLVREAVHTKYSVSYVSLPAGLLHAGENVISLEQPSVRSDQSYIMYDYVNLELP